jgi:hypothetical protein
MQHFKLEQLIDATNQIVYQFLVKLEIMAIDNMKNSHFAPISEIISGQTVKSHSPGFEDGVFMHKMALST